MEQEKKYTLAELTEMAKKQFGYGTPLRDVANEYASDYDFDSDTLDVKQLAIDMFVYGAKWTIEQLNNNN